jgi:transcriptional regulator with XRE-family HTH domain
MGMAVSEVTGSERFLDDGVMSDWQRLGNYVLARRVELGYKRRGDFAQAIGVSARVVSDLENGRRGNFDPVTIAALEDVLGWETGSATRVAAGGDPSLRAQPTPAEQSGGRELPDEIQMIYASTSMTPRQKLEAIRLVLELRAQAAAGSAGPRDDNGLRPEGANSSAGR